MNSQWDQPEWLWSLVSPDKFDILTACGKRERGQIILNLRSCSVVPTLASLPPVTHISIHPHHLAVIDDATSLYGNVFHTWKASGGHDHSPCFSHSLSHKHTYTIYLAIYILLCLLPKTHTKMLLFTWTPYIFTLSKPLTPSHKDMSSPLALMEICMQLTSVTCRCRGNTSCRGYQRPASVMLWDLVITG